MSFGVFIPFVSHLGFELTRFEGGESTIEFSPQPAHQNSFGVTHGGALMTLGNLMLAIPGPPTLFFTGLTVIILGV